MLMHNQRIRKENEIEVVKSYCLSEENFRIHSSVLISVPVYTFPKKLTNEQKI